MSQVRAALEADLADVARVTAAAYLADELVDPDHWYVTELRAAGRRAEEARLLVAVDDGRVVGTVTVAAHGSPWAEIAEPGEHELRMLAVDPAARGRGIGEQLLRAAVATAFDTGAAAVVLSTLTTMRAAQRMYDRVGLRREPGRDWEGEDVSMLVYVAHAPIGPP